MLKHTGADTDAPAPAVLKTTEDRNRRISDLEIECATLRHGLRLADRRWEDAMAAQGADDQPVIPEQPNDAELRRAVREITRMLGEREWGEHISQDPDASALESAVTTLIGERQLGLTCGDNMPGNESTFVLRATNRKAMAALHFYAGICNDPEQTEVIRRGISEFKAFDGQQARTMRHPAKAQQNRKNLDEQDEPL